MRYLLMVSLIFLCCKVKSQTQDVFDPHKEIQKKIAEQNKKLLENNSKEFWEAYTQSSQKELVHLFNKPIQPGRMPVMIEQKPIAGIILTIIEQPVTAGKIPDLTPKINSTSGKSVM